MQFMRSRVILARAIPRSHALTSPYVIRQSLRRHLASNETHTPSSSSTASSVQQTTPPPINYVRQSKWRNFLQILGRTTLIVILGGAGTFYYITQRERHPGPQLPFDSEKKTLVVLGSGWGATSFLKTLDTEEYNVVVISPKNFFLFTPLLPSVAVGTLNARSIIQPTRYLTRHKKRQVAVIEAEATNVDPINKTITFSDNSEIKGTVSSTTISYDYLVYAVGAEVQTFNIPGVKEHACFMKELSDAERMQRQFMDCMESAAFPGQNDEEIKRLLHMVVVGGGPTGVELSGSIHDWLEEDLKSWFPELADKIHITLIEALPSVLPTFSKQLIEYTQSTFKESKIDILTKTMVKEVKEKSVVLQTPDKSIVEMPCGLVVWAAGNKGRKITQDLMTTLSDYQKNKRGLTVDDYLRIEGAQDGTFAIGDCTATAYAPTAQVASQQGAYLARVFAQLAKKDALQDKLAKAASLLQNTTDESDKIKIQADIDSLNRQLSKIKPRPFHYSHQGSLAYIGSEKAIADLPFVNGNVAIGGLFTSWFWHSVYLSTLYSIRNRTLVGTDWLKVKLFGRDVSRE